jgi:tripartite-type tricarboxylate transporter receptor subunit TctC
LTLSAVLLEQENGIKLTPVSYRGVPLGMPDLMTGRIHFGFIPAPLAANLIDDGKLVGLAVTGNARIKRLPNVPTMAEQGFGSSQVSSWYAFATTAKTPRPILEQLNAAFNAVLKESAVITKVEEIGGTVEGGWTPERTTELFAREVPRWKDLLHKSGIVKPAN